jgi:hypothetical protein
LNTVELIENNPISKLSKEYNNKLINKIKENFTGFEQQLFISSFYCYLNYDKNLDFVIDLDNVWKWMGFSSKQRSQFLLEKYFKLDIDYKNLTLGNPKTNLTDEILLNTNVKQNNIINNTVGDEVDVLPMMKLAFVTNMFDILDDYNNEQDD